MEIVNVGSVSVDDAIEKLLEPQNIQSVRGHGALCFALVREMIAPGFYGQLVENAATIDATTREHIAFIVFYGDQASLLRISGDDRHRYMTRQTIRGLSISGSSSIQVQEARPREARPAEFDSRLGHQARFAPSKLHRPSLSQHMGRASQVLMERYAVPESALPCLLFVDVNEPTTSTIVCLSPADPLRSLYEHALAPLSQEFAELGSFWKRRAQFQRLQWQVEAAVTDAGKLPVEIAECDARLERASKRDPAVLARAIRERDEWRAIKVAINGNFDDATVSERMEGLSAASGIVRDLKEYHARLSRAKDMAASLEFAIQNKATATPAMHLDRERLKKRLGRLRQSLHTEVSKIEAYLERGVSSSEWTLSKETQETDGASREKKRLEERLTGANAIIVANPVESVEREGLEIADVERAWRARGYGDDVLTATYPAAFSVIRSLKQKGKLGMTTRSTTNGGESAMRILFLAANPAETTALDLEEELRGLEQELRGVRARDRIVLVARHAVRPDDLVRHVRADKPNVIHFSGHGCTDGIVLRSDAGGYQVVSGEALQRFLNGRGVDLVVLNSCYSKDQVKAIKTAVRAVVGTTEAVDDEAARRFTVAFYRSVGNGLSVKEAFRDGGDAVALHGLDDVFHADGDLDMKLVGAVPA